MNLPPPRNHEWIPNWPVAPHRVRCLDPHLTRSWSGLAQEALEQAHGLLHDEEVLRSVDKNAQELLSSLQRMTTRGLINPSSNNATLNAAVVGGAVGKAALLSKQVTQHQIHPVWHLTLFVAEQQVAEFGGLHSIMALNAAFRGWTTSKPWASTLE